MNGSPETETAAPGGSEDLSGGIERASGGLEEGCGPGEGLAGSWGEADWTAAGPCGARYNGSSALAITFTP